MNAHLKNYTKQSLHVIPYPVNLERHVLGEQTRLTSLAFHSNEDTVISSDNYRYLEKGKEKLKRKESFSNLLQLAKLP